MSEQATPQAEPKPAPVPATAEDESAAPAEENPAKSVKVGTLIILLIILGSLAWYLLADRYTPYTSQARVQGYVVGVAPKVAGVVTEVWVGNNQMVEKGERLFEIDPSQYRIALERARSDWKNAKSQVDAGSAGVEAARANLHAALANELKAEQDVNRLERLHKEDPGTISVRRLEVSRASLGQARAKVSAAEADIQRAIEQMGGDDEESNAILRSAQSAVEKAELDLANTVVEAPSRGVITDLRTDVGQYAGTGSPVMTLIAIQDVWISAEFTENNLGHLHPGSPVEILFDVLPGQVLKGELRSIGLGVSAGQAPPPGTLPSVSNNRDWLRQAQRFPVVVGFDVSQSEALHAQLRVGGQASVIAYSDQAGLLRTLGELYIRLMSWLSYAY
ncbi:MAG: HlyD family secretion protein [Chromatiaceae bacterium]|nr:HlyD family secretion protein [Chromatiaceae bacterium]